MLPNSLVFPAFSALWLRSCRHLPATPIIMHGAMTLFETGAVQRQRPLRQSQQSRLAKVCCQQIDGAIDASGFENGAEGTPKRVMIRRGGQADIRQPLWAVAQELFGASITQAVKLPQHQAGEELGQSKILA